MRVPRFAELALAAALSMGSVAGCATLWLYAQAAAAAPSQRLERWIATLESGSAPQSERAEAVASAVARPGPGIVFGGLTSAAAFFSLQVVSYPAMKQLAWLTGIGLLAIMASSFVVLPLVSSQELSGVQPLSQVETMFPESDSQSRRRSRTALRLSCRSRYSFSYQP